MGRQTFYLLKKSDFVKLVHDAEGPYVDALEFTRRSIGRGLRWDRLKAGLKQTELAAKAGIRVETLRVRRAARGTPRLRPLRRSVEPSVRKCEPRRLGRSVDPTPRLYG